MEKFGKGERKHRKRLISSLSESVFQMSLGQRETCFKMKTVRSMAQNELKKLAFNFCLSSSIAVRSDITSFRSDVCTNN
jgi:hypothetical protein